MKLQGRKEGGGAGMHVQGQFAGAAYGVTCQQIDEAERGGREGGGRRSTQCYDIRKQSTNHTQLCRLLQPHNRQHCGCCCAAKDAQRTRLPGGQTRLQAEQNTPCTPIHLARTCCSSRHAAPPNPSSPKTLNPASPLHLHLLPLQTPKPPSPPTAPAAPAGMRSG